MPRATRSSTTRATRSSPAKKVAATKAKTISKRAAPKKVTATRRAVSIPKAKAPKAKAVKKTTVPPKRNAKTTKETRSTEKTLELCLILDCTGSMYSWIQRSKDTLHKIIDSVKSQNKNLSVRVSFVAYRDVQDHNRFDITDFTENLDHVKANIQKQPASGGGDFPEDV